MKTVCSLMTFFLSAVLLSFGADAPESSPGPPLSASLEVNVLSSLEKPVPGVEVYFYSLDFPAGEEVPPCRGYFREIQAEAASPPLFKKDLPPGAYRAEVRADGWQSELIKKIDLQPDETRRLEVRLKPGYAIAGQVVNEQGLPLAGANVRYWSSDLSFPHLFSVSRETRTENDGSFRLPSLNEGIYTLNFSLSGYVDDSLKDVGTGTEDCRMVLKKGFVIKGKIKGDTSGLDKTARLEVKTGQWRTSRKNIELDEGKNFVISGLEKESCDLCLKDGDYISDWLRNIAPAPSDQAIPVVLTAYKGASLSGRVIDAVTGLPLEGAQLRLYPQKSKKSDYQRSDAEGNYRFPALAGGDYELKASLGLDPYSEYRICKQVSLTAGQERADFDLKIDAGREVTLRGMVVDDREEPIEDVKIRLHCRRPTSKSFQSDYRSDVRSDSSGSFNLSAFIEGEKEIRFSAEKEGYAPVQGETILLSAEQDSVDGVSLKLNSGASLQVEVVDEKEKPVSRARVVLKKDWSPQDRSVTYLRTRKQLTDLKGLCRFDLLPPDFYRVEVVKSGYGPEDEKFELEEGESEKSIRMVLEEGRDIRVFVRDSEGNPIEEAEVSAMPAGRGFTTFITTSDAKHRTGPEGLCVIEDLPRKPLRLRVEADGYEPVGRMPVDQEEDKVEVVLKEGGGIVGRLLGVKGKPVEEINIRANLQKKGPFDFNFGYFSHRQTVNLGDGYFKIKNLKAGDYTLKISCPGLALKEIKDVEVKAGEKVDLGGIKLQEEGTISGRVVWREDGSPVPKAWVKVKGLGISSYPFSRSARDQGQFELKNIPPGSYTIVVSAKDYREKEIEGISVSAGEEKELPEIELEELTEAEKEEKERKRNYIPSLGVRVKKIESSEDFSGIPIGEVEPGSAAAAAGLAPGDVITRVNGKTLRDDPAVFLGGIMGKPGTKIKLTLKREEGQQEEEVDLTIGDWDYEKMYERMEGN